MFLFVQLPKALIKKKKVFPSNTPKNISQHYADNRFRGALVF